MQVEVRKIENGYLIVTKEMASSYALNGIGGGYPQVNPLVKEYVATSLDSAMDKLRELLK